MLGYIAEMMGCILVMLERMVPSSGLWEHMLGWTVNVLVKAHEQVKERTLTLQGNLVILAVGSKQVNNQEINHLHH